MSKADDLDSISKRLRYIVDSLGVKQSHMAEKLGMSPSGLHYILNNEVKFSKNAKKIINYLNVSENWLLNGEGRIYEENTSISTYKVPLYHPDQLKLYGKSGLNEKSISDNFVLTTYLYLKKTLGIYVTETNFSPKFEVNDILVFEQDENFQEGEILLTYFSKIDSIALKYGFHVGDEIVLISYEDVPIKLSPEDGDMIIGAYRECFKKSCHLTSGDKNV